MLRHISRRRWTRTAAMTLAGGGLGSTALYLYASRKDRNLKPGELTTGTLLRSYAVFSMCSIPALVDYSPRILEILTAIPVVKQITEAFVRVTFFDQFVGGDTAHDTLPLLRKLRASNKGALFAYSVEVDEFEAKGRGGAAKEDVTSRIVDEMIRCIDVAADFEAEQAASGAASDERRTWVAVKITALLPDATALIKLSKHLLSTRPATQSPIAFPGAAHVSDLDVIKQFPQGHDDLNRDDIFAIDRLCKDLDRICTRAKERGVKIIIDAEYSWYQPALDALTFALMRKFNALEKTPGPTVQPLIYATFQAYLRRTPELLAQSVLDAKKYNYALGVKLVRGAYHPHEIEAHSYRKQGESVNKAEGDHLSLSISPDPLPPVWQTKAETDICYNKCVRMLFEVVTRDIRDSSSWMGLTTRGPRIARTPRIGVLFGTHNWDSCQLIIDECVRHGLGEKKTVQSSIIGEENDEVWLKDELTERVTIGQLYGMGDALSDWLVEKTRSKAPFIIKYVPYGALSEVMPYLGRRAIENKSMLGEGGAGLERRRAWTQFWKRISG